MTSKEYTSFADANAALIAAMASGTNTVSIKSYQRASDLAWVWLVTSAPTTSD